MKTVNSTQIAGLRNSPLRHCITMQKNLLFIVDFSYRSTSDSEGELSQVDLLFPGLMGRSSEEAEDEEGSLDGGAVDGGIDCRGADA